MKVIKFIIGFSLLIMVLHPKVGLSQVNIFEKDAKLVKGNDLNVMTEFLIAEAANSTFELPIKEDGTCSFEACNKSKRCKIPLTIFAVRENKNLFYSILYAEILDINGYSTQNAYAGYIIREFGETKEYLFKVKKKRLFPDNNIFTEVINLNNGIQFTIQNRAFVSNLILPAGEEIPIPVYFYKDCY